MGKKLEELKHKARKAFVAAATLASLGGTASAQTPQAPDSDGDSFTEFVQKSWKEFDDFANSTTADFNEFAKKSKENFDNYAKATKEQMDAYKQDKQQSINNYRQSKQQSVVKQNQNDGEGTVVYAQPQEKPVEVDGLEVYAFGLAESMGLNAKNMVLNRVGDEVYCASDNGVAQIVTGNKASSAMLVKDGAIEFYGYKQGMGIVQIENPSPTMIQHMQKINEAFGNKSTELTRAVNGASKKGTQQFGVTAQMMKQKASKGY